MSAIPMHHTLHGPATGTVETTDNQTNKSSTQYTTIKNEIIIKIIEIIYTVGILNNTHNQAK